MAWVNIPNASLEVGAPIRSIDILTIRENFTGLANGDSGAPKIKNPAYNAGSISADKLNGNQTGSAPSYAVRAWVNFDARITPTITASGNVSSITDLGVGQYGINFVTNMIDTKYAFVGNARENDDTGGGFLISPGFGYSKFVYRCDLGCWDMASNTLVDSSEVNVMIMR